MVLEKLENLERAITGVGEDDVEVIGAEVAMHGDKDISGDEGVSVTFETVKEDQHDGLRRRIDSSNSGRQSTKRNETKGANLKFEFT